MSNAETAIWAVAAVLSVALVVAAHLGKALLEHRAAKTVRDEQREERESGAVAQLRRAVELNDEAVKKLRNEVQLFVANNRR